MFCKTPSRTVPASAHREDDTFIPQPRALTFKVEVTFCNSQASSKTQVPALLLEHGLFHHSAQQIAREFSKKNKPFLA